MIKWYIFHHTSLDAAFPGVLYNAFSQFHFVFGQISTPVLYLSIVCVVPLPVPFLC